jgi:hypothetical protein
MAGLNNFMFTGKITNRRDMAKKIDARAAAVATSISSGCS